MKSYEFLFWAYNVIWGCIAAFTLFMFLRTRTVERRIAGLERELQRRTEAENEAGS